MSKPFFACRCLPRSSFGAGLVLLVAIIPPAAAQQSKAGLNTSTPRKAKPHLNKPAATVRDLIQEKIQQKRLDDLRWPDFSDVSRQVDSFYRSSNYALAWVKDSHSTERAEQMIRVLYAAEAEGLNSEDYDGPRWPERIAHLQSDHTAQDEARFDLALTVCAMRYISAVRLGRINPKHLQFDFDIEHKRIDMPSYLARIIHSDADLQAEFVELEPSFPGFEITRQALLRYMELAKQGDTAKLPRPFGIVFPGGPYDDLPGLARRLRQLGDLPSGTFVPEDTQHYDEPFVSAVKSFQQRHGLKADGYLNLATVEQLNIPLRHRVEQLRLTLERYRWLPLNLSGPPVVVNLPEFRLRAFEAGGRVGLSMRVNVGDSYDFQTPVFQNSIRYLVFRPYWNVPPRILREEVIPDIEKNRDYAAENNMEVITPDGKVITSGEISDGVLKQLQSGRLGVRERPGPENALGLLKIIFPNEHHVYLHDTPQSSDMFFSGKGALSHGCIHLEEPAKLAYWLLRDKPGWSEERVEEAMHHGRDNVTVNLTKPVPILIVYATAIVPPDGKGYFFQDIYGFDAVLEAELAKGYPYP